MRRGGWTNERISEKMGSIDSTFDMLRTELQGLRADNRQQFTDLRSDLSGIQRQLVQIGFSLVGVPLAAMVALIVALA